MDEIKQELNSQVEDCDIVLDDYHSDEEHADEDEVIDWNDSVKPSTKVIKYSLYFQQCKLSLL